MSAVRYVIKLIQIVKLFRLKLDSKNRVGSKVGMAKSARGSRTKPVPSKRPAGRAMKLVHQTRPKATKTTSRSKSKKQEVTKNAIKKPASNFFMPILQKRGKH